MENPLILAIRRLQEVPPDQLLGSLIKLFELVLNFGEKEAISTYQALAFMAPMFEDNKETMRIIQHLREAIERRLVQIAEEYEYTCPTLKRAEIDYIRALLEMR